MKKDIYKDSFEPVAPHLYNKTTKNFFDTRVSRSKKKLGRLFLLVDFLIILGIISFYISSILKDKNIETPLSHFIFSIKKQMPVEDLCNLKRSFCIQSQCTLVLFNGTVAKLDTLGLQALEWQIYKNNNLDNFLFNFNSSWSYVKNVISSDTGEIKYTLPIELNKDKHTVKVLFFLKNQKELTELQLFPNIEYAFE